MRRKNNSESQQASRIQSHCGRPGVNSPSQTYVHHQSESSESYPSSWPRPLPPPPKTKEKIPKAFICLPSNSQRRFRVASARGPNVDFDLRATMCFLETVQGDIRILAKEAVTSCGQRGLCCGRFPCVRLFPGSSVLPGTHLCLAAMGSTSQGAGKSLF